MYDTIYCYARHDNQIDEKLIQKLSNPKITENEMGFFYNGNLNNLKISYSQNSLFVKGSLSKYYFNGENQNTLNIDTTKEAIENISDCLNYDIKASKLTRLDIAQNIIVSNPPESYYNFLGDARYYNRLEMDNSLIYKNSKRLMIFYNKILEQRKSKTPIIPIYKDENVLRYELRVFGQNKINNYFNNVNTSIKDLYKNDFFKKANDLWYKEFNSILKVADKEEFNDDIFLSAKKFIDQLTLKGIESVGGYNEILKAIAQAKKRNVFERQDQIATLKRKIKRFNGLIEQTSINSLVMELENKILDIYLSAA